LHFGNRFGKAFLPAVGETEIKANFRVVFVKPLCFFERFDGPGEFFQTNIRAAYILKSDRIVFL
jgi:hypothetical protein